MANVPDIDFTLLNLSGQEDQLIDSTISSCSLEHSKFLPLMEQLKNKDLNNFRKSLYSFSSEELSTVLNNGQTILSMCLLFKDTEFVTVLMEQSVNVNVQFRIGTNFIFPLQLTIEQSYLDGINLLIDYGANYDQIPSALERILKLAIKSDHINIVRKIASNLSQDLIQFGFHESIIFRSKECLLFLSSLGADVNFLSNGIVPLLLCVMDDEPDMNIANILLRIGSKLDRESGSQDDSPLILAVKGNMPNAVRVLLNLGADYNVTEGTTQISCGPFHYHTVPVGNSALHLAVLKSFPKIVEILVEAGANINQRNYEGDTPLHLACKNLKNGYQMVKLLIRLHAERHSRTEAAGGDIAMRLGHDESCRCNNCNRYRLTRQCLQLNAKNCLESTPLMEAIQSNNIKVVDLLLNDGADPCVRCNAVCTTTTALHLAVKIGSIEICKKLLQAGCNLNETDKDGFSCLHLAAIKGNLDLIKLLSEVGVNVKALTMKDENLIHLAIQSKNIDLIEYLLNKKNLNSSARNSFLVTPLMLAARLDSPKPTAILVKHNVDLNLRDISGETALLHAVYFGNESNAAILIAHGADINIGDRAGSTPLYWCIFNCRERTLKLLLLAGAKLTLHEFRKYPSNLLAMRNDKLIDWVEHQLTQPFSLENRCRLEIRKRLIANANSRDIAPLVNQLNIPPPLKRNLLFYVSYEQIANDYNETNFCEDYAEEMEWTR